ncbi:amidohydrolase family protein [Hominifimenecus sp. rT4P-3]|uniref:amidohydrolase family protein n=1 Tax=Hominifimenecus sp. rT4P-3 TaxID=3242979 RepID=UPI003DA68A97
MKIIDAHIHFSTNSPHFDQIAVAAGYENTTQGLQKNFADAGVCHGIVMGNRSLYPEDHKYPDFLHYCIGLDGSVLATVNPKEALALVEENLKRDSCVGIKLYPGYSPYYLNDPMYAPFYQLAEQFQKPVAVHMGATATSGARLKYSHPLTMDDVAAAHPKVSFVMCHLGNPWIVDAVAVLDKNPNVAADLSGILEGKQDMERFLKEKEGYLSHIRTWLQYAESYDRLLYGTDWPLANEIDTVAFAKAIIPEKYWEQVFYKNARKIYSLGDC